MIKEVGTDFYNISAMDKASGRQVTRLAKEGKLFRIARGVYVPNGSAEEIESHVQRHWQKIAGVLVPNAVVSHISAMTRGLTEQNVVTLSHPTRFNRVINLPGVTLALLQGPAALPGDMALGNTGLYWSSRPRAILENLGLVQKKSPRRLGREKVESALIGILNASGEAALNKIRDEARVLAPLLDMQKEFATLDSMVGALLGTHSRAELRTRDGLLVVQGTPVDKEREAKFELLAAYLRSVPLPMISDIAPVGAAKVNFAFIESYFSNYVEGTKFSIEEATGIVLRNELVLNRPKDSHDVLGVFKMAINSPGRDSVPPPGVPFLDGVQSRHAEMLKNRPEAEPGQIKTQVNYAGQTRFVEPGYVRGTLTECSALALSIPEGLARAIFYAFLISEIHPFADGNGRLSRLIMNAELSRLGLCRIIIPTLFHPQYVDCARRLTNNNDPEGFVRSLSKMAVWCSQFNYENLPDLIQDLRNCNAMEDSPSSYRLLNKDGTVFA
jgi:hypothetical protein